MYVLFIIYNIDQEWLAQIDITSSETYGDTVKPNSLRNWKKNNVFHKNYCKQNLLLKHALMISNAKS